MKSYKLQFGTISIVKKNLAEVIVDEGVEMTEDKVKDFHDFLVKKLKAPFSVLVNKKHSYSYTFLAQKKIGQLKELKAMAVVANSGGSIMSTETLIDLNKNDGWNIKLFKLRQEAMTWLKEQESIV